MEKIYVNENGFKSNREILIQENKKWNDFEHSEEFIKAMEEWVKQGDESKWDEK